MDFFQEWFPFFKTPIFNYENFITNSITSCITCHPFGIIERNTFTSSTTEQTTTTKPPKPTQEIRTISSLVDKFTIGKQHQQKQHQTANECIIYNQHNQQCNYNQRNQIYNANNFRKIHTNGINLKKPNGRLHSGSFNLRTAFNRNHHHNYHPRHLMFSRSRSFTSTIEMKHEIFTPCVQGSYGNDYQKNPKNEDKITIQTELKCINNNNSNNNVNNLNLRTSDFDECRMISSKVKITPTIKISSTRVMSANNVTMKTNYEQSDVIVVPPRRRKKPQPPKPSDTVATTNKPCRYKSFESSISVDTDESLATNLELILDNTHIDSNHNSQNSEHILDDRHYNCISEHINDVNVTNGNNKLKISNKNHNNSNLYNNKSGCSSLDLASGILNFNVNNDLNGNKNIYDDCDDDESTINNNDNEFSNVTTSFRQTNKVYYKDINDDENTRKTNTTNNIKIGFEDNEIDEILVCESILTIENDHNYHHHRNPPRRPKPPRPPLPPPPPPPRPKDSTYTTFCTDSLYHDKNHEDNVSSSSFESKFEQINRLQSGNTNGCLISTSPFTKFRIRKHQKRVRHGSLIKDFGLILPSIHKATSLSTTKIESNFTKTPNKTGTNEEGFFSLRSFGSLSRTTEKSSKLFNVKSNFVNCDSKNIRRFSVQDLKDNVCS